VACFRSTQAAGLANSPRGTWAESQEGETTVAPLALEVDRLVGLFAPIVQALRKMVGGRDRIELVQHQPDKLLAWTLLFRTINLLEAAVQAAKSRQGETLALLSRSLLEMAFLTRRMQRDQQFSDQYTSMCTSRAIDRMNKLRDWLVKQKHNDHASAMIAQVGQAIDHLQSDAASSGETIAETARKAGMEEEYRLKYTLLCADTHHRTDALAYYVRECRDGLEVHQVYPDNVLGVYLGTSFTYAFRIVLDLIPQCGVTPSNEYKCTVLNTLKQIGT